MLLESPISTSMMLCTLHGLPKTIVFDRDVCYTRYFRKTLWHLLGTKLKISIAFHLHIDDQRVVNCSLGNLLWSLFGDNLESWDMFILYAKFAYDAFANSITSRSSFEVVHVHAMQAYQPPPYVQAWYIL